MTIKTIYFPNHLRISTNTISPNPLVFPTNIYSIYSNIISKISHFTHGKTPALRGKRLLKVTWEEEQTEPNLGALIRASRIYSL